MKKGTKVFTFQASSKLTAPTDIDGRTGVITGIIPAGVGPKARYEVTFDKKDDGTRFKGVPHSFDFYAEDLEPLANQWD
jgi:hypothetical protein